MNNAQFANAIKEECKSKGVSVTKMLLECKIRKSLIYDLEKRDFTPSIEIAEKIANYLDCSVDYLLGRTDNPNFEEKYSNNNIYYSSNFSFGNNSAVTTYSHEIDNETVDEVCTILSNLSVRDRSQLLTMMYEFYDDHKK